MTDIVEATSLSNLTPLAADPPWDPRTQAPFQEPLVLYIARVPGSRDIFLTPIKPRKKVVTAEDIESSLYFLHVHGPDDERIERESPRASFEDMAPPPPPPPPHRISPSLNPDRSVASFDRTLPASKPLPMVPSSSTMGSLPAALMPAALMPAALMPAALMPAGIERRQRPPVIEVKRKPIGTPTPPLSARANLQNQHNAQAGQYQQRQSPASSSFSPPYPENEPFPNVKNWQPRAEDMLSPLRQEFSREDALSSSYNSRASSVDMSPSVKPPSAESPAIPQDFRFTLIRRDPATGDQWNVARILSHSKFQRLAENGTKMETSPTWMELTMDNPGYQKFLEKEFPSIYRSESDLSASRRVNVPPQSRFQRKLRMEDSKFPDSRPGHRQTMSEDSIEYRSGGLVPGNMRRDSGEFMPSEVSSIADSSMSKAHKVPRKRIRKSGYAFRSPWNGRCEFSSAIGSSTLKCLHSLGHTVLSSELPPPKIVSELRFNLPGRPTPAKPASPNASNTIISTHPTDERVPRRSRLFGRHRNRSGSRSPERSPGFLRRGSEPNVSASILDLSLGQERAGGGFSGKQSKLGKLIIEHEGLMMLDLLVAANLSLWWKAYEKG
ncbi:hypothetical protein BT63DRAFT_429310 [Microthyrium microscopicum]|uniref:Uncharacterized protein n=1 Tax=Microthyrium microscopicum TaxID=703497 RepID=A0A6A6TXW2_9PEZI|nr:hypothetical protein BT63DRAFT_429310 [Microthyrium microscopicum]